MGQRDIRVNRYRSDNALYVESESIYIDYPKIDIPTSDGIEEIPNSWYAWTADGFCASTKENKIYWKGQGSGSWFTGYKIFCYDIDKDSFYQVFDFQS